jgi:hypothetical protein
VEIGGGLVRLRSPYLEVKGSRPLPMSQWDCGSGVGWAIVHRAVERFPCPA